MDFTINAPQLILNSFLKFRENMKKMFLEKINLPSAFLLDMVTNNPFLKKLLILLTSHKSKKLCYKYCISDHPPCYLL